MSQTINVPLSGRGIERLIRETENRKNRLQERTAVFLDRVAQEGMEIASIKFSQAVYDGTNDVSVTVEPRGNNVRAVVATGGATTARTLFPRGSTVGTMFERWWRQAELPCSLSSVQA